MPKLPDLAMPELAKKPGTPPGPALEPARSLPVVAHAVSVFGDEKKASHWLATPLPLFGGRSPAQVLEQEEGVDLVEQVLTRIEHNISS